MLVIDIGVRRCSSMRDDPFDLLVSFELIRKSLLVDLERFDILSTRRRVVPSSFLRLERSFDVILHSLESLEC